MDHCRQSKPGPRSAFLSALLTLGLLIGAASCRVAPRSAFPQGAADLFSAAAGSPLGVPFAPGGVLLGDINHDGLPDLVVRSSESPQIAVYFGNGSGGFLLAPGSPLALQEPASEIAAGDLNGDDWLDLVLANHDSYRIQILIGDGSGSFIPHTNSLLELKRGQHPHTHGLALGDLNNDGHLDLVTGNTTDSDVVVGIGDGKGGFAPAPGSPFEVAQGPYPLALDDLNNDGNLDLAITSTLNAGGGSGRSLTILLGDGTGGFRRLQTPVKTPDPWFVAIADVNGDRIADLLTSHWESGKLTVLLGAGDGSFLETPSSPLDFGHAIWYLGLADMNGDGKPDLAAAADDSLRLMIGDGSGLFSPAPGLPYPTGGGSWRLAIGDLNADGKPDLLTSNLTDNSVTILLAR